MEARSFQFRLSPLIIFAIGLFASSVLYLPSAHAAATELYSTPLLSDANLLAYWRLEGNSNDYTSNNNGSDNNVSYGTAPSSLFGQHVYFNGSGDNSQIGLNEPWLSGTSAFTISVWYYVTSTASNAWIVGSGSTSGGYSNGAIHLYLTTTKPEIDIKNSVGTTYTNASGTVPTNIWTHLVATYDGTNLKLYQNGSLLKSASASGTVGGGQTNIASEPGIGTNFNGYVDDIAFLSRALTATEVSNLYNGAFGPFFSSLNQYYSDGFTALSDGGMTTSTSVVVGATLHGTSTLQLQAEVKPTGFPFADTANVTSGFVSPGSTATTSYVGANGGYHWQARVVDANGSSSDWQAFGATGTSTVDFIINHNPNNEASVYFDGSSGWAWPASTIALTDTGPLTIELWYKAATSTVGDLIDTRSTTTGEGFLLSKNSNGIAFALSCGASSSIQFVGAGNVAEHFGDGPPPAGPYWHHVAISKGSTSSTPFSLYFDGAQQTTTNCFDASTSKPIWFGRSAVSSTDYFTGNMDEVRIWSLQRTADQVSGSSTQEISPTSTGLLAYWTFNGTSIELASGNATSGQTGTPTFSSSTPLGVHFIESSTQPSVHNGMIRWSGSTQFSQAFDNAVDTWNAAGPIVIASTTGSSDLSVGDISTSTGLWMGVVAAWTPLPTPPDSFLFNSYYLASDTLAQVQNTATHELGHALGLDHSVFGNIMYYRQTTQTVLGSQDITDYDYLWGN